MICSHVLKWFLKFLITSHISLSAALLMKQLLLNESLKMASPQEKAQYVLCFVETRSETAELSMEEIHRHVRTRHLWGRGRWWMKGGAEHGEHLSKTWMERDKLFIVLHQNPKQEPAIVQRCWGAAVFSGSFNGASPTNSTWNTQMQCDSNLC